jgi:hypothetical protein
VQTVRFLHLVEDAIDGLERLAHAGDAGLAEQGLERLEVVVDEAGAKACPRCNRRA